MLMRHSTDFRQFELYLNVTGLDVSGTCDNTETL
jgi:hypothetical protein